MADEQDIKNILDGLKAISGDSREAATKRRVRAEELILQKKTNKELDRYISDLKDAAKGNKEHLKAVKDLTESVEDAKEAHEKARKQTEALSKSFIGLGSAAMRGEGTISSFTDNFKGLGVIGDSLGFLGNRLDTNIETFRQLSQIGATFGQSIVELRQTAATAALPLDDFAALVRQNSTNLAALFGSTTQGAKGIALLGESIRDVGIDRLAPLGFTVDEVNETLLLNLERQRRTNMFSRMTDQQRISSAIRFAEELDRLARLTGAQRDELRAQIEQQQSNAKFQAFLQGATDGARTRLETFAASVGNIAPGLNEGFQDLIANAGVPVTESALALIQNIPQASGVVQDLISGAINSETALSRLRDAAGASVDRFRKATVTGQVEFLALQGDVINLGRRIVDVDSIFAEQGETADRLTQGLTTFEDASKRISGQFQQIETGLLAAFGPALGGLSQATQFLMKGVGGLVAGLAQVPALTGTAIASILAGKFLLDKAGQTAVVFTGTLGALRAAGMGNQAGMFSNLFGSKGGKRAAGAARFGATRLLPGIGAAIGVGSSAGQLMNKDKSDDAAGIGGLVGAGLGGLLGLIGGPGGALLGAGLGSMAGQFVGGMFGGERAFGGGMDAGKTYLTGERGPELVTAGTKSTVTANQDLKNTFNTEALEAKMATMTTELNNANKALANMVNGVNTLVAVESRALKAVETTARKDRNQVGLV
jgi:hypothetical protein